MKRANWKGVLLVALASGGIASAQPPALPDPAAPPAPPGPGCCAGGQGNGTLASPGLLHCTSGGRRVLCFPDHAPCFGLFPTQWRPFPCGVIPDVPPPPKPAPAAAEEVPELLPPPRVVPNK
jgi:hypothetical protein